MPIRSRLVCLFPSLGSIVPVGQLLWLTPLLCQMMARVKAAPLIGASGQVARGASCSRGTSGAGRPSYSGGTSWACPSSSPQQRAALTHGGPQFFKAAQLGE